MDASRTHEQTQEQRLRPGVDGLVLCHRSRMLHVLVAILLVGVAGCGNAATQTAGTLESNTPGNLESNSPSVLDTDGLERELKTQMEEQTKATIYFSGVPRRRRDRGRRHVRVHRRRCVGGDVHDPGHARRRPRHPDVGSHRRVKDPLPSRRQCATT